MTGAKYRESTLFLYIIPIGALIAIVSQQLWGTFNQLYGMYANIDGEWAAWNLSATVQWSLPFDLSPFNPLSGLGSSFLPNLPWLNPATWPFFFDLPRDLQYLLGYIIYMVEVAISLVVLLSAFKIRRVTSTCVVLAYLLILFPPFSGILQSLGWYSLAPVNAHLVAMANIICALLIRCGANDDTRRNVLYAMGIVGAAIAGFYSAPITFLTYAPTFAFFLLAGLIAARPSKSALVWKLSILIVLGGSLIASGFLDYVTATSQISSRSRHFPAVFHMGERIFSLEYWQMLWGRYTACGRPQVLLCDSIPIYKVHLAALLGAMWEIHRPTEKHTRSLGLFFLLFVIGLHLFELIAYDLVLGKFHVISTPYHAWAAYPFEFLFVVLFVRHVIRKGLEVARVERALTRITPRLPALPQGASTMLASIFAIALSSIGWKVYLAPNFYPPPAHKSNVALLGPANTRAPVAGPIVQYLVEQTALAPGKIFRGYTASIFGDPNGHIRKAFASSGGSSTESVYVYARDYLDHIYRNRMHAVDLWLFNIPTYEEYGQWIARDVHNLNERLFGDEAPIADYFLHVHKLDIDLLRMFGVRFIITDIELNDAQATLRITENGQNGASMRLYEVNNPNLASFSPTQFVKADTVEQTVAALQENRATLDAWGIVRTTTSIASDYVPVTSSELVFERDGFSIRANTSGRSIVILPIRYSRCFEQQPGGTGTAQLWRINGVLSAIEFTGTIDVRYRYAFGLFSSAQCRLHDNDDIIAMGF